MVGRVACPACGNPGSEAITPRGWSPSGYDYSRCGGCGLGRLTGGEGHPDASFYDDGYFLHGGARAGYSDYVGDEFWHRRTARSRLHRVARWVKPGGTLVDVGTAVGYLPCEARQLGYHVAGVEVSEWAANQTRQRAIRVEQDLADLSDLAGQVDAVTFFQVLEHMPDPAAALSKAVHLLRPGGVVVCETWDASSRTARLMGDRWQQLSPPSVLWLFDQHSARRMVEDAELLPLSWRHTPKVVSVATVLGQASGSDGHLVERLTRPLVTRIPIPYLFDDLVTFAARKPL